MNLKHIKIVLVTGVFDVLHRGHVELLNFAASRGRVVVGLNDDVSVRKLKGPSRPVNNENDRMFVINSLRSVYFSFLIRSTTVDKAILEARPDYWVKGGDYTMKTLNKAEVKAAKQVGTKIVLFKSVTGYSTTDTLEKQKL